MEETPLIPVRILCTREVAETAQVVQRLLAALGYRVDLCSARLTAEQIEEFADSDDVLLIVWSSRALTAHHMRQIARRRHPSKLVEITLGPIVPTLDKRAAPVIDFTHWNGTRGGHAWRTLEERLRAITRGPEAVKPPPLRAAMALGMVSALAVAGAVTERVVDSQRAPALPMDDHFAEAMLEPGESHQLVLAAGGPITAFEPAGADDPEEVIRLRPARGSARLAPLDPNANAPLADVEAVDPMQFPELRLVDRIALMAAPLRRDNNRDD